MGVIGVLAQYLLLMQVVKQTRTTLFFGVLLAIIVTILVVSQFNNTAPAIQPTQSESASALPMVQKSLVVLKKLHSLL